MTRQHPVNLPASVHQRLLTLSQQRGEEFNRLLTLYAIERLLYRLTQSSYADRFVLKGALLFLVWAIPGPRPTRTWTCSALATTQPQHSFTSSKPSAPCPSAPMV